MRRVLSKFKPSHTYLAGQPIKATHPELLKTGELTPGISAVEYEARRTAFLSALPSSSIALLPAAAGAYMAGHIPFPYRQDADFMYLTGVTQPNCVAMFGGHDSPAPGYTLFVPDPSDHEARWRGPQLSAEAAALFFGADEAYHLSQLDRKLSKYLIGCGRLHYDPDRANGVLHVTVPSLRIAIEQMKVSPLRSLLHTLRWRKSAAELELLRQSAETAAEGITQCMQLSQPGVQEHRLAATFEYCCKMRGASNMAYPPVVAGGSSATIIHYGNNDKVVHDGELLLMDAGCERHGYASDVTRTWPVSGKFSPEQRAVYDIVYEIYQKCLQRCRLGTSLRDIHQYSIKLASEGIADLRLLSNRSASSISRDAYREFYPHSVGHWLGMDTHDCATQSQDQMLQPGVVMTLEPGLYIPDSPKYGRFAGIGIRLEDDVGITSTGPCAFSSQAPLDPDVIEDLVGSAKEEVRSRMRAQADFRPHPQL